VLLALHVDWLTHAEMDAKGQREGYERLIARMMRSTYP
jgi:hypothetical protein